MKGHPATQKTKIQNQALCKLKFNGFESCVDTDMDGRCQEYSDYSPLITDKEIQFSLPTQSPQKTTCTSTRRETRLYRSVDIKKRVCPIVQRLQVGSVRKATMSLLLSNGMSTRDESIKGVCDVVKKTSCCSP